MTTGTTNESWARANLKESDIRAYDNGGFVFNDLGNGRIDAVISSHFGGMKYANVNKLPIKEVGPVLIYQLSAPAMAKGQQPLKEAVSKAIGDMTRDGTIDRLARRWVGPNSIWWAISSGPCSSRDLLAAASALVCHGQGPMGPLHCHISRPHRLRPSSC